MISDGKDGEVKRADVFPKISSLEQDLTSAPRKRTILYIEDPSPTLLPLICIGLVSSYVLTLCHSPAPCTITQYVWNRSTT